MSARRFSLDSNVLVYVYDYRDPQKRAAAEQLVVGAAARECMLALQAIGEFYTVMTRKNMVSKAEAAREAQNFLALFAHFPATVDAHRVAAREASAGRFSYWDAVLLASAGEAGCRILFSEDMRDGARLGDVTVRTPFASNGLSATASAALTR